jgi:hypothetical protein
MKVKDLIAKLSAMDGESGVEIEIPRHANSGDRYPAEVAEEITYYSVNPGKSCVIKFEHFRPVKRG